MRIGIVADPPMVTHSCAVVAGQLAKQWVKLGHEVFYLGYNYTGEKVQHKDGYDVFPDTAPPTRKASVSNFIKETNVDILYAHGSKDIFSEGIQAAKEHGIPYLPHTFYSSPTKTDKVTTFEAKNGFVLYDCDQVDDFAVCNNFSVGVGFVLGKRTWFVPNGIDTTIFKPSSENYRKELGIPANAFVVLFSGSNISGKDPSRAVAAFAEFYKKGMDTNNFLVMHTRPETDHCNLRELASSLGVSSQVKFLTDAFPEWLKHPENYKLTKFSPPYTSTPYELMGNVFNTGDVLIAPTLMEGMSTTMLEAMGCGLPIICSDDPVVSEIVVPYKTGLVVHRHLTNECITEELADALEILKNDVEFRSELSSNSTSLAHIKYNWETIAKQLLYIFKNLKNKTYV